MINIQKEFDLDDVHEKLLEKEENVLDTPDLKLKCIGVQDTTVLFVYNAVFNDGLVTKFGIFFRKSKETTTIYTHPETVDVLVGSLNEEKSLLVFARKKHPKSTTYNSYLVELNSKKLFDLKIENPHTQYLLFLPWKNAKQQGKRQEYLVFFLEKRRLGIVHVTTTRNKSDKLEVQQIQPEYLVHHYVWFQIDLSSMRLYFIYLQQKMSDGEVTNSSSMFNVLQFSSRSNPEIVLSVSLPLPLTSQLYSVSKRFMVGPTSCYIPDSRVVITVLTPQPDCLVLCVAFHSQYFVYLTHSGNLVTCKHGTAEDKTESIIFVEMAGYVVVYSPPNVLHFIDASSEHSIKNSMVCEEVPLPLHFKQADFTQCPGKAMPLSLITTSAGEKCFMVKQKTIYRISIEVSELLASFKSVECPATWSFLLHMAVAHLKNMRLAHEMMLHCITINPGIHLRELLKEFLLTSTHLKLSRQEDITADILSAVPYVNEESQIATLDRNRIIKISNIYQTITKHIISLQKVHLFVSHVGHYIRFNLEDFVSKCSSTKVSPATSTRSPGPSRSSHSSADDLSNISLPPEREDESSILCENVSHALQYHIRRRFDEMISMRASQDSARLYFKIFANQGIVVMSLILMSAGKFPNWYPEKDGLVNTAKEPGLGSLLKILDIFKFAMLQLCNPLPQNYDWLHVYTAYRILPKELFLRRLSDRSLTVSVSTVHKFLNVLPPDSESQAVCSALVSTLSRSQAFQALKGWDNLTYRQFTAQNYLVALRGKIGFVGPVEVQNETPPCLRSHPFIPVNSFYSYLYHKLPNIDMNRKLQVLSENSMEQTRRRESDDTLRGVTFY